MPIICAAFSSAETANCRKDCNFLSSILVILCESFRSLRRCLVWLRLSNPSCDLCASTAQFTSRNLTVFRIGSWLSMKGLTISHNTSILCYYHCFALGCVFLGEGQVESVFAVCCCCVGSYSRQG